MPLPFRPGNYRRYADDNHRLLLVMKKIHEQVTWPEKPSCTSEIDRRFLARSHPPRQSRTLIDKRRPMAIS